MVSIRNPSVSVIIPAYNAARTLRACLESIGRTEYQGEVEIVVVDDVSTDDTCAIAGEFDCALVRQRVNGGPALARNAGAKAAKGDVLFFLDADTVMRPDTIAQAVRALRREGVGAVTGMYEAEPINDGFFPRYYAYLKYHTFTASTADGITAFGGQCGAVYRHVFERVGGYRPIQWGMDIENEELGLRINEVSKVALGREVRVGHNFPGPGKLLFIFTNRVYWWVLFRRFCGRDETVLMTRGFGVATAALPAGAMLLIARVAASEGPVRWAALAAALAMFGLFVCGYAGFWRFCLRRRGIRFALGAAAASLLFSFVITASAAIGHVAATWAAVRRRNLPFVQAAPEPA